jgi:hypothetical protein
MRDRLTPKMTTAMEVAVLVKCLPNIKDAADLIDQYARTVASGAVVDATAEAYDRVFASLNKPLAEASNA